MKFNNFAYRSGILPLTMLLLSVIASGQVTTIVNDQRVEIMDGNSRRGEIIYGVTLEGAKHLGDQSFEYSNLAEVKMRITLRVEARNDKWASRMKIGIGRKAFNHHEASIWQATAVAPIRIGVDDGKRTILFFSTKEGVSNLILPYTFLDTKEDGWVDEAGWSIVNAQNRIALPRLTLRKAAVRTASEAKEVQEDIATMFAFYKDAGNDRDARETVRKKIERSVTDDFRRMVYQDESIPTTEKFIAKYATYTGKGFIEIDEHLRRARINIVEVTEALKNKEKKDDPVVVTRATDRDREETEWRRLFQDRDTTRLRVYLEGMGDGLTEERRTIGRDSLSCWSQAAYRVRDVVDGRQIIELINFVTPAYYDIYGDWIAIDNDRLRDEHLLSIDIRRSEKIRLLITDKSCPGKSIEIPLDNLMRAELTVDSVRGLYHFDFTGGSKPYTLKLLADTTDEAVWYREDITDDRLVLSADSLQAEGLRGHLSAEVYSYGSDSPVTVSGGMFFIPSPPSPRWILPLMIALTIGGLALLVLYILRRGKRGRADIFSKA